MYIEKESQEWYAFSRSVWFVRIPDMNTYRYTFSIWLKSGQKMAQTSSKCDLKRPRGVSGFVNHFCIETSCAVRNSGISLADTSALMTYNARFS